MRDKDLEPKFSWPVALFITGISFIAFFYILEKLNEAIPIIFLWIGITAIILAIASGIGSLLKRPKDNSHQHRRIDQ
jgi:hypothetical protein